VGRARLHSCPTRNDLRALQRLRCSPIYIPLLGADSFVILSEANGHGPFAALNVLRSIPRGNFETSYCSLGMRGAFGSSCVVDLRARVGSDANHHDRAHRLDARAIQLSSCHGRCLSSSRRVAVLGARWKHRNLCLDRMDRRESPLASEPGALIRVPNTLRPEHISSFKLLP